MKPWIKQQILPFSHHIFLNNSYNEQEIFIPCMKPSRLFVATLLLIASSSSNAVFAQEDTESLVVVDSTEGKKMESWTKSKPIQLPFVSDQTI